ncbi:unnamed protein product, partial [Discosporangium mesarthrocarpum]
MMALRLDRFIPTVRRFQGKVCWARRQSDSPVLIRPVVRHHSTATSSRENFSHRAAVGAAALLAMFMGGSVDDLPSQIYELDDKEVEWNELYSFAQMANMTSASDQHLSNWFERAGYSGKVIVREVPEVFTRYFLHVGEGPAGDGQAHHIAIRGTKNFGSLKLDMDDGMVEDKECGCLLHAGFKEVADSVMDDIVGFLEPGVPVKLSGHSLGGSVAVIL